MTRTEALPSSPDPLPASPAEAEITPRGPWAFLRAAVPGGCSRWGVQLMLAWLGFSLLTNVLWAGHLKRLTGWSALPSYWGEMLTARDLWELMENGGLRAHWSGPWVPLAGGLAMLWFLWSGWRLQAHSAGLPARFGAWLWGRLDTLLIGALPLGGLTALLLWILARLGGTGIQGLGWLDWVGGGLLRLVCVSALILQWWLCRMGRAEAGPGWRLGSWRRLAGHLGLSFRRLWLHPLPWFALVLGGVLLRTGLSLLVLAAGWRLGGGTIARVLGFLALQLLVVLVNAWQIGWFLRLAGLFLRHDAARGARLERLGARLGVD